MRGVVYLDLKRVTRLHQLIIGQSGGSSDLLQQGLLESAIAQPSMVCFGQELHSDIPSKAAAYHFHLCKNHAFADGNKRIAHMTAEVFLMLNGYELSGTVDELEAFTLGVADGSISKDQAIAFFRLHATPATQEA